MHSSTSALTTYAVDLTTGLLSSAYQIETFSLAEPGPVADRQEAPHPHETILDPTGKFILVPDLGADLVRVFGINQTTGYLLELDPLVATPGTGPRHAHFWSPKGFPAASKDDLFFYVVGELASSLKGYKVSYPKTGGIAFEEVFASDTYGGEGIPVGNAPAEIQIDVSTAWPPFHKEQN